MSGAGVNTLEPNWPAIAGVRACCTLRTGGVSQGSYASLNLAAHVGDAPVAVAANRRLLGEVLALPAEPRWLEQVHGSAVLNADEALESVAPGGADHPNPPRADAAVSRIPGTVLAVLVADCLPVLLAARRGGAVGVAHAGWRGLAGGVLEAAVRALAGAGPLQAWLGPAIGMNHFEVGEDVRTAFLAHDSGAAVAFARNARGRWQCDLKLLARARLASAGVEDVHACADCSYEERQRFFSYRRDGATGRMAALIWCQ